VSHAFHSPSVAPAAEGLGAYLAGVTFQPLARRVLSTVTSDALPPDTDLRDLLVRQVLEPVHFHEAARLMAADVDLMLEVGPGRVLSGLAADIAPGTPCVALDTDSASLTGLLAAVAAAYALGAPVRHDMLFGDRFTRPLPLDKEFRFFASPCELAPADDDYRAFEASFPFDETADQARAIDDVNRDLEALLDRRQPLLVPELVALHALAVRGDDGDDRDGDAEHDRDDGYGYSEDCRAQLRVHVVHLLDLESEYTTQFG